MIKQILTLTLLIGFAATMVFGQTCTHSELSKTLIFKTSIQRILRGESTDSCIIKITITNKATKRAIQTVRITSTWLLGDSSFVHCNDVRSYTTGVNAGMLVSDWDYGDIIVADFNFDDREDFAVKAEEGGNGGPIYNYYVQTLDSTFILDKFLNDEMNCFPGYFNRKRKTLTSICRSTTVADVETIYQYDILRSKWVLISRRYIDLTKK